MIESLRIEWVDPVTGASELPPTEMQDLADDAGRSGKRVARGRRAFPSEHDRSKSRFGAHAVFGRYFNFQFHF